jgi:hypothetical protein
MKDLLRIADLSPDDLAHPLHLLRALLRDELSGVPERAGVV